MEKNDEVEEVDGEEVEETETEVKGTKTEPETTTEKAKDDKPSETLEDRKARLERQLKQTNKKLGVEEEKPEPKTSKTDDLDYGQKAFLATQGIKGIKELTFVKDEMKKSGMDMDTLLENPYFTQRLTEFRELNITADATPKGKRSGTTAVDSVDYWMTKPFEEVPQNMRAKVVQAKLDKEKNKGQFYNS